MLIKDCSLGLGLPVLGLVIDDGAGRYAFHLGSDPSPVTALERCFTEMSQGGSIRFRRMAEAEAKPWDIRNSNFWKTQFHLSIQCYGGHWPPVIFTTESDRIFAGFDHRISESDTEDLRYLTGILQENRWQLLIRDNSFLGLPSYHVYIPEISNITNALDNGFAFQCLAFDRHLHVITNPAGSSLPEKKAAVDAMADYAAAAPTGRFRIADALMFFNGHPLSAIPLETFTQILLNPNHAKLLQQLPCCFLCSDCDFAESCSYPYVSGLWNRLKAGHGQGE